MFKAGQTWSIIAKCEASHKLENYDFPAKIALILKRNQSKAPFPIHER